MAAALIDARVCSGFIADGQHICPIMLDVLLRAGRGSRDAWMGGLFLVSDALSPLGLADGIYHWDSREIEVIKGTARLADGTLSGTTLPLIAGAQNLVKWGLCGVEDAIALVTKAPRDAIGRSVPVTRAMADIADPDLIVWGGVAPNLKEFLETGKVTKTASPATTTWRPPAFSGVSNSDSIFDVKDEGKAEESKEESKTDGQSVLAGIEGGVAPNLKEFLETGHFT